MSNTKKVPKTKRTENLGQLLASYREARGITQLELAEKLGFSRSYVSVVEFGTRVAPKAYIAAVAHMLTDMEKAELREVYLANALEGTGL